MMPPVVMLDLMGLELTHEEHSLLQHPQVAGVILFTRNYATRAQLRELIQQIRRVTRPDFLIAVDQEGGRVQRFRNEFVELPALGALGHHYQHHPSQALQLAETAGWIMASELLAEDLDFSFAPILDLNKPLSQIIANRAFHADPQIVIALAKHYLRGMQRAGMAATGKHFPGHGSVEADSHVAIPVDQRTYQEIEREDLVPFAELIKENRLSGIMPAHVVYSQVDETPAGFSKFWIQQILRQHLNFQGVIFSDDLTMAGAHQVGDLITRARLALTTGCDVILICNDRPGAMEVLQNLERHPIQDIDFNPNRLRKMLRQGKLKGDALYESSAWQQAVHLLDSLPKLT